ncbi:hypothetical protein HK096_007244, partial [Nowakowskiella sp. JEL0078]
MDVKKKDDCTLAQDLFLARSASIFLNLHSEMQFDKKEQTTLSFAPRVASRKNSVQIDPVSETVKYFRRKSFQADTIRNQLSNSRSKSLSR